MNLVTRKELIWIFAVLALASYAILSRIWVAEDAYISFRYTMNLLDGNGFVFNAGERVEGSTNPYWILFLSLLAITGLPLHQTAIVTGFFLSISAIGLWIRYQMKTGAYFFWGVLVLISHEGIRDFSTSGLEFSLTFFLVTLLLVSTFQTKLEKPFLIGTIVSLLYHTRPEMGLLIPLFYFFRLWESRKWEWNWIFRYGSAILLFAISYHIFRFFYFGDIFPNTFYAKSGSASRYIDGWNYLMHFLWYSKFSIISSISILGLIYILNRKNLINFNQTDSYIKFPFRETILALFVGHYIIRVGGDFMAFRLLLPYFVILLFAIDSFSNQLLAKTPLIERKETIRFIFFILAFILVFEKTNYPLVSPKGIVNERKAYTKGYYDSYSELFTKIKYPWFETGVQFRKLQACLDINPFIITNSVTEAKCNKSGFGLGYFSYAAGPNVSVIDELGLTDREVAKYGHKQLQGKVGHERSISLEQVIQRKVIFCSLEDERYDQIMDTPFGVMIRLDDTLLSTLGKSDFESRMLRLASLKKEIEKSNAEKDMLLMKRLALLEHVWNVKIESLASRSIKESNSNKSQCWNN
jgi:hypothetical protein